MTKKSFDSVRLKNDIQQRLLTEMADMSPERRRRFTEERILSDELLARLWSCRFRTSRHETSARHEDTN